MDKRTNRLATIALATTFLCQGAWAFRPFDSTDASVTENGKFEIEAGVGRTRAGGADSLAVPALAINYGLLPDTEITLEGQLDHQAGAAADGPRDSVGDTMLSMKHVWRRGTLQDESGPSIATECGVLLPEVHGSSGTGGECTALVSNRWDAMALHLNLGIGRTREHETSRTLGVIAEGPDSWVVRPVAELLAERDTGSDGRLDSALVGAIWQRGEDLAFDFGFRRARTDDGRFNELRLGVTWSFAAGR